MSKELTLYGELTYVRVVLNNEAGVRCTPTNSQRRISHKKRVNIRHLHLPAPLYSGGDVHCAKYEKEILEGVGITAESRDSLRENTHFSDRAK